MKQNRITCAIIDAELKLAELIQFDDDERCTQLESILVQNQVREAISCPLTIVKMQYSQKDRLILKNTMLYVSMQPVTI